jgi:hypothetical protein
VTGKELFNIWAPGYHERWTKFAKPSLFVNVGGFSRGHVKTATVPLDIFRHRNDGTAFIVDLPGAESVESGLALAELGFLPVPLYNGINETNIGGLNEAVKNAPIADALLAGAEHLKNYKVGHDAFPVFLLDYDRNKEIVGTDVFDNRWSIEPEDFPDAYYLKNQGVKRVAVWTGGEIRPDLAPIIEDYKRMGIEISTYCYNKAATGFGESQNLSGIEIPQSSEQLALQKNVRIFENARFGLLLLLSMGVVNFLWQWSAAEEPLLWTTPCLQWLTYLWVPERVGDAFVFATLITYSVLYFFSRKLRFLLTVAFVLHAIDTMIFTLYVIWYDLFNSSATIEYYEPFFSSLPYAALVFAVPLVCLFLMGRGIIAQFGLMGVSSSDYMSLKGYAGYAGYGGSGRGGYRGRGYRGRSRSGFGG